MSDQNLELAKLIVTAVMAVVLIVAMTWIVVSPYTDDAAVKGALVIVGSAVGFIFGRETR
jgi:multidrug resistance efflux pump